jgi:hypothetical protein
LEINWERKGTMAGGEKEEEERGGTTEVEVESHRKEDSIDGRLLDLRAK